MHYQTFFDRVAKGMNDVSTDGQIDFRVLPKFPYALNLVADFGAKGDGSSNDTAAFNRMREACLALNPRWISLTIPGGDYLYVHPRWLRGIQNITVYAYGATFTNVGTAGALNQGYAYGGDCSALLFNDSHWNNNPDQVGGFANNTYPPDPTYINQETYLIDTVVAGATSVFTLTAGDAAGFSVGDDVFLYGFDQQPTGSFPPNPRYFEYRTVVSANGTTGEIVLDQPLRFRYRPDWVSKKTYEVTCGASRISNMTRANHQRTQNVVFHGGEFKAFSEYSSHYNGVIIPSGVRNITLYDVTATGCLPQEVGNFRATHCHFIPTATEGMNESDKGCEQAVYDDCDIKDHQQGTGIHSLEFRNCRLSGLFQSRARVTILDNCDVSAVNGTAPNRSMLSLSGYASHLIHLQRNRFYLTDDDIYGIVGDGTSFTLTVKAVTSATHITVDRPTHLGLSAFIEQGSRMHTTNVNTYNTGIVTDFWEDVDDYHILGHWNGTVAPGDVFVMFSCQRAVDGGNAIINKGDGSTRYTSIFRPYTTLGGASHGFRTDRLIDFNAQVETIRRPFIIKNLGYYSENIVGTVTRLVVNVQRAYTDTGTCTLAIDNANMPYFKYGDIDCTVAGMREWRIGEHVTQTADANEHDLDGTFCEVIQLNLTSTDSAGSSETLPLISLWLEAIPAI